jgi:hypothetical protein
MMWCRAQGVTSLRRSRIILRFLIVDNGGSGETDQVTEGRK